MFDIVFYAPSARLVPSDGYRFTAFTPLGHERLNLLSVGRREGHSVHVETDDDAETVLDHITDLEVFLDH